MAKYKEYVCPFCGVDDFDGYGLKLHFLNNRRCKVFNALDDANPHVTKAMLAAAGNEGASRG